MFFALKNLTSEQNYIHYNEEQRKQKQGKLRRSRGKICKQHNREAEHDGG